MSLKIFIDTEFTDFIDCHLISLGMAAESGQDFYVEVPYPDEHCSAFVREAVLPLLGKIPHSFCLPDAISHKVISWLENVRCGNDDVEICFDYSTDWDLFVDALDYCVPIWCVPRLIASDLMEPLVHHFHKEHKLPIHHALYDAQANRYAFSGAASLD
ncbi:hypothetical protein [Herminiimonas contaminans]|uniref:Uncharacterized protein n=1 Tax=Herminiimonas contaminans TaxID=1111140 RepID=A0ABS0EY22_9BURK|nr:hypothetical protein [Herminiimonas contaminans]MBF8179715.1 hypothetical protein [Herminiimonas contaminans]